MMHESKTFVKGLEGVVVDESAISEVDGAGGHLRYRGYSIEDLVAKAGFPDVVWLVLFGSLPDASESRALERFLVQNSSLEHYEIELLRSIPLDTHPMAMLQAMMPLLRFEAHGLIDLPTQQSEAGQGLILAARLAGLIAAFHRLRQGLEPVAANENMSFHRNFLWCFSGIDHIAKHVQTLNATQILQMEHSFNASTFACRVCASTLAPVSAALSAAIGTLSGRLHGGADEAALRMAIDLGAPEKAPAFVRSVLERKERIMGVGHREYKVVDPRARVLKPMAQDLCRDTRFENVFNTLVAIESAVQNEMQKRRKQIWANVEFYKGAVFYALGIPPEFFTAMFAMARCFGYVAHVLESRKDNRLIRPQAHYTGHRPRTMP